MMNIWGLPVDLTNTIICDMVNSLSFQVYRYYRPAFIAAVSTQSAK